MNSSVKQTLFVTALIHNDQQEVLVVRRNARDHFLPGYLELPGGRVELGESLEHALKRKLLLEIGVGIELPMYYTSLAQVNSQGPYVRTFFEVAFSPKNTLQLSDAHDEYLWINATDLLTAKITADAKTVLEKYLGKNKRDKTDGNNTTLTIYTDGGSRGNPGPSASAYVIYDAKRKLLESGGSYIGITTNNRAEYTAVVLALQAASRFAGPDATITFNIDSLLVVNQMGGSYKIKNRELWPLNQQIRELITAFKTVKFNHVPREQNAAADAKVNEILNAHTHDI